MVGWQGSKAAKDEALFEIDGWLGTTNFEGIDEDE